MPFARLMEEAQKITVPQGTSWASSLKVKLPMAGQIMIKTAMSATV